MVILKDVLTHFMYSIYADMRKKSEFETTLSLKHSSSVIKLQNLSPRMVKRNWKNRKYV